MGLLGWGHPVEIIILQLSISSAPLLLERTFNDQGIISLKKRKLIPHHAISQGVWIHSSMNISQRVEQVFLGAVSSSPRCLSYSRRLLEHISNVAISVTSLLVSIAPILEVTNRITLSVYTQSVPNELIQSMEIFNCPGLQSICITTMVQKVFQGIKHLSPNFSTWVWFTAILHITEQHSGAERMLGPLAHSL